MDKSDIIEAFKGISEPWKNLLGIKLRQELALSIKNVNDSMRERGKNIGDICPQSALMFNAFRLCPYAKLKVVIIGQDPYLKRSDSIGFPFSSLKTISPSLLNIYNCLVNQKLIDRIPKHGDLSNWAMQGVLMLNAALTNEEGESTHVKFWENYIDKIITEISLEKPGLVFILLGNFARKKRNLISGAHHILEWGHPSPLNNSNKTDNPDNFNYCTCFTKANNWLISQNQPPIIWGDNQGDKIYIFTDGGSKGNGKAHCKSSWSFCVYNGDLMGEDCGIVEDVEIAGQVFKSSNNRGELTAILKALTYIETKLNNYREFVVVSDSEYSINSINLWVINWIKNKELKDKKNLDIIMPARETLDRILSYAKITFKHIKSHKEEPLKGTEGWFLWFGNNHADLLCNKALGR